MEEIKQHFEDEGEKIRQHILEAPVVVRRPHIRKGDRLRPSKGIHVGALNKVREQPRKRR